MSKSSTVDAARYEIAWKALKHRLVPYNTDCSLLMLVYHDLTDSNSSVRLNALNKFLNMSDAEFEWLVCKLKLEVSK